MIPFDKPAITVEQQLDLLVSRGLKIKNKNKAAKYLEIISYFRLSAYMRPYQKSNDRLHNFYNGVEFKHIVDLYAFDSELRILILQAIESIEVAVRSMINITMSNKNQSLQIAYGGSHWYLYKNNFKKEYDYKRLIASLKEVTDREKRIFEIEKEKNLKSKFDIDKKNQLLDIKRRENYCRYYLTKYSEPQMPPGWALIEELSLGELSHLYKGLAADSDRKKIASRFNTPQKILASWLHTLTFVRNVCAHHARLWNRELSISPALMHDTEWKFPKVIPNTHIQPAKRMYVVILLIRHLMESINPNSEWQEQLIKLLNKYPNVPLKNMGFPESWDKHHK